MLLLVAKEELTNFPVQSRRQFICANQSNDAMSYEGCEFAINVASLCVVHVQTAEGRAGVPLALVGSGLGGDCAPTAANFRQDPLYALHPVPLPASRFRTPIQHTLPQKHLIGCHACQAKLQRWP